jgi:hypothetical protein
MTNCGNQRNRAEVDAHLLVSHDRTQGLRGLVLGDRESY